ncbi:hemoglobin cathodic subunit beta [Amia ocellicauda]|uniref:hemoglobin cathodic subunit beta n=1 Tax=Amia ocellicauda TaxID=2972642 RepID=UPI003463C121|nr:HBBC protein [Amia calva]
MVEWTDAERAAIAAIWGKIKVEEVGPHSLARLLIVYPWTQRYFGSFGNLSNAAAILGNAKVAHHGAVVLGELDKAVKNLDHINETFSKLSVLHSEKLHVDPDNFRLLGDIITIVLAAQLGSFFTVEYQAAWHKFLDVVISALRRQYH